MSTTANVRLTVAGITGEHLIPVGADGSSLTDVTRTAAETSMVFKDVDFTMLVPVINGHEVTTDDSKTVVQPNDLISYAPAIENG